MAARHYNLTITAAAQKLSAVYSDPTPGGKLDEAMREIWLTAETDCFVGGSGQTLTTSIYGAKILAAATAPYYIGPFDAGAVKLSEISVIGTSGVLHIQAFPY